MRLRWAFLASLLAWLVQASAAGQAVNPATLKPPTPRPRWRPSRCRHTSARSLRRPPRSRSPVRNDAKYFANAVQARQYEQKVRDVRASYQQPTDREIWITLAAKVSEAEENTARHAAAGEQHHEATKRLEKVPVIDCTQQGSVPGQGHRWGISWSFYGGVGFGSSPSNRMIPLPAGQGFTAPNGRPSEVVPTWFLEPGSGLLNGVLGSLGHSSRFTPLEEVLSAYDFNRGVSWTAGAGATFGREFTPDEQHQRYFWIRAAVEAAQRSRHDARVDPEEDRRHLRRPPHECGQPLRGHDDDHQRRLQHVLRHDSVRRSRIRRWTFRRGSLRVPWRSPLCDTDQRIVQGLDAKLDYGFIVGGVQFHETDNLSLTFRRSGGFGLEAGVKYHRGRTLFDVTLSGHHREDEIVISAAPVSVAGAERGAVAFATPSGVDTIVFNNISGLTTSLSGTANGSCLPQIERLPVESARHSRLPFLSLLAIAMAIAGTTPGIAVPHRCSCSPHGSPRSRRSTPIALSIGGSRSA